MSEDTSRMNAHRIFEAAVESARDELARSSTALGVSALAGGMTMGVSAMGVAVVQGFFGGSHAAELFSMLLYPLGFVAVIIGRAQLFTENTLYPVILVMKEPRQWRDCLRLWSIVLLGNVIGVFVFAVIAGRTTALLPEFREALAALGTASVQYPWATIFWSGVLGGWLIALVAWLVSASHWTSAQIVVVYLLTFLLGAAHFAHCIAGSAEVLSAVVQGKLAWKDYLYWMSAAATGNVMGGVFIVSALNFGQVNADD